MSLTSSCSEVDGAPRFSEPWLCFGAKLLSTEHVVGVLGAVRTGHALSPGWRAHRMICCGTVQMQDAPRNHAVQNKSAQCWLALKAKDSCFPCCCRWGTAALGTPQNQTPPYKIPSPVLVSCNCRSGRLTAAWCVSIRFPLLCFSVADF